MYKVDTQDLEEITKFLDSLAKPLPYPSVQQVVIYRKSAEELSKMIKDKYTEIKPDYEQ